MIAFHNKPSIKKFYLARVKSHAKADEIIKGVYWENGKGCAVGYTIHGNNHVNYETELGIPRIIARLEDKIFENLPTNLAKTWPLRFLEAIKPGADLSLVWDKFASRLLTDPIGGVIQYAKTEEQLEVIQRVSDLYEARICGLSVVTEDWHAAADAAYAADAAAAYSANAADAAAAYSANAADAAAAAAYSANAADAAAADAADAAAAYSANAADAADAAAADAAAARKRAFIWQSELLLELLKDAR